LAAIAKLSKILQKKPLTSKISGFSMWWAHQDLNLGPKDYEQLK